MKTLMFTVIAIVLNGIALFGAAHGQTVPTLARDGRDLHNQPLVLPRAIETMAGTKVDAMAGVMTRPSIVDGVRVSVGVIDADTTTDNGVATGYHGASPPLIDCPTSTQKTTSMLCIRGAANGPTARPPFLMNINLDSYPAATGEPVALYAGVRVHSGAPQSWAFNTVTHIEPGAKGGIGAEIDLNNWACDAGANSMPASPGCSLQNPPTGLLITGASPYPNGSAINISGASTANAQWHDGIQMLGGSIIDRYSINTNNLSQIDYNMGGSHLVGLDLLHGTFAQAAIRMNVGQQIVWASNLLNGSNHYIGSDNTSIMIANAAGISFKLNDTGGAVLNTDLAISGQLNIAPSTPTSSSSTCTAGQVTTDATYIYWCASTNRWLRTAGSAF